MPTQKQFLDNVGLTELLEELGQHLKSKLDKLTVGDGIAIDNNNTIRTTGIPYGECDSTSTATAFTATVPGIYKLEDGVCCLVKNGVVTSASGFTLNINGLGAKPSYNNMTTGNDVTPTAPTRDTTIFNINYTMLFIYSETIVSGGGWICYRGYDANTNTIGYQVRSNSMSLPASQKFYRYRLLFTSADGTHYVPANTSTSTNATASRTVNQTPIDPFGHIVYYGTTAAVEANARPGAAYLWIIYTLTLGYSFNRTGAALTLTSWAPVYIKCAPQADGSAIIDADTPYVQALPSTADGKIYIFLGVAYNATSVELLNNHPVYYHDGTGIRLWTGKTIPSKVSDLNNDAGYITSFTETDPTVPSHVKSITQQNITDWNNKQNALTFDNTPTSNSTNPVTSGGVKTALDEKQDKPIELLTEYFDLLSALGGATESNPVTLTAALQAKYDDLEAKYMAARMFTVWNTLVLTDTDAYSAYNSMQFKSMLSGTNESTSIIEIKNNGSGGYWISMGTESWQRQLDFDNTPTANSNNPVKSGGIKTALDAKQATLVSGTNIKTVNSQTLLGSGDILLNAATIGTSPSGNYNGDPIEEVLDEKQDTLVSGTNIKTVNNNSLLGSGNLDVSEFYKIPLNDSTLIFYAASGYIPDLSALNTACDNLLAAVKNGKIPVMKFSDGIADVWVAALVQYPENSDPEELLPMSFTTLYNSYTTYTIKVYKDSNTSNWIILRTQRNLQSELTFDSTPTASSANPVTSNGIKTYIDNLLPINISPLFDLLMLANALDEQSAVAFTADNLTLWEEATSTYNYNLGKGSYKIGSFTCIPMDTGLNNRGWTLFGYPFGGLNEAELWIWYIDDNGTTKYYLSYELNGIQKSLVSGTSIKTINNTSILGSGNIAVQPTLVGSGTGLNIKTINNTSLLGSGNISPLKVGSVAGKLYRNNVGGSGNFSISGNSGCIPNLTAGTFLVAIYAKSATQSYTFTFNFGTGNIYSLSTTNGELNDLRTITISSSATFSGSVSSGSVAAGTILYVVMYNYLTPVQTVGIAAVTNRYADLDGTPTIPTVNNGTLTIQKNGTSVATFTANQSNSVTANITTTTPMTTVAGGSVTLAMTANTLYKIGSAGTPCTSLTITLTAGTSDVANYYHGIVITGANMTFNKPSTVKLGGGKSLPTFTAGGTFEFSILENIMYFEYTEA